MAPQCISRSCWCSPWPLLDIGLSEMGRISCSRVPRRWSECPRRRIPFFRNRRGYCCTNAWVERSLVSESLAVQAASTGPRTGSCCCSCCRSAISVGEARWSRPVELPQCRTAPLHCPSASRQLLYTVSRLVCDSSTSNPDRSARFVGERCGDLREAGWKHEWRATSQRLL